MGCLQCGVPREYRESDVCGRVGWAGTKQYIHTYLYTYIHTHIHTYIYTCIYTYIQNTHKHTNIYIYIYTCIHNSFIETVRQIFEFICSFISTTPLSTEVWVGAIPFAQACLSCLAKWANICWPLKHTCMIQIYGWPKITGTDVLWRTEQNLIVRILYVVTS